MVECVHEDLKEGQEMRSKTKKAKQDLKEGQEMSSKTKKAKLKAKRRKKAHSKVGEFHELKQREISQARLPIHPMLHNLVKSKILENSQPGRSELKRNGTTNMITTGKIYYNQEGGEGVGCRAGGERFSCDIEKRGGGSIVESREESRGYDGLGSVIQEAGGRVVARIESGGEFGGKIETEVGDGLGSTVEYGEAKRTKFNDAVPAGNTDIYQDIIAGAVNGERGVKRKNGDNIGEVKPGGGLNGIESGVEIAPDGSRLRKGVENGENEGIMESGGGGFSGNKFGGGFFRESQCTRGGFVGRDNEGNGFSRAEFGGSHIGQGNGENRFGEGGKSAGRSFEETKEDSRQVQKECIEYERCDEKQFALLEEWELNSSSNMINASWNLMKADLQPLSLQSALDYVKIMLMKSISKNIDRKEMVKTGQKYIGSLAEFYRLMEDKNGSSDSKTVVASLNPGHQTPRMVRNWKIQEQFKKMKPSERAEYAVGFTNATLEFCRRRFNIYKQNPEKFEERSKFKISF